MNSTVKEGRLQGGEEGQASRAIREQVEGSMSGEWTQRLSERSAESWFYSKSGQT